MGFVSDKLANFFDHIQAKLRIDGAVVVFCQNILPPLTHGK